MKHANAWLLTLLPLFAACQTQPRAEPTTETPIDHTRLAQAISTHNEQVDALSRIHARGVVELRWRDDAGRDHAEPQVNARLWIDRPGRTGLRAEKLGEVLFWLGSDDAGYWMFDLMSEPTTLFLGAHDNPGAELIVPPLALIDLIGLVEIPAAAAEPGWTPPVLYDEERSAWVIETTGAGGPMRIFLASAGRPVRVEALAADGAIAMESELGRYKSVPLSGYPPGGRPLLPTLIDLRDPPGVVSVKLALDEPDGDLERERWDVVFDLDRLRQSMRPEVVRGGR